MISGFHLTGRIQIHFVLPTKLVRFVLSVLEEFQDDELSYALGKQGGTRKKLERASGLYFSTKDGRYVASGTAARTVCSYRRYCI